MPRKGYRKPPHQARSYVHKTPLNETEKRHLFKAAAATNVTGNADFVRRLIMGFEIKHLPSRVELMAVHELASLSRQLSRIDNNLNQLAKIRNSGQVIPVQTLIDEIWHLQQLRQKLADKLNQLARR